MQSSGFVLSLAVAMAVIACGAERDGGLAAPSESSDVTETIDSSLPTGDEFLSTPPPLATVYFNELSAANDGSFLDEDGDASDWIEFFNAGSTDVSLAGWSLTDDEDTPQEWVFPDTEISAGSYLVVFASGKDSAGAELHTNFKLKSGGEFLGLFDEQGQEVDALRPAFPKQDEAYSYGVTDSDGWQYLQPPTPGGPNGNASFVSNLPGLSFSHSGGTFVEPFELVLGGLPLDQIRYTTDGTLPTDSSKVYTGPISIDASTQVRVWVLEEGKTDIASRVYVALSEDIGAFHSNIPLVFIESDGESIDGGKSDLVTVSAVFMDVDESGRAHATDLAQVSGRAGMRVRGNSSQGYEKKQYAFEWWTHVDEDKDRAVLGMPGESDWIIHGPYSDKTLMRNHLMYLWSNRMGRYAPRTRFAEVFLNTDGGLVDDDDYVGVYVIMEKIKRGPDRVNIAKLDGDDTALPDISGGYLLKKDWWDEGFETEVYEDQLIYVYPDATEINTAQEEWVLDHFNAFEQVLSGPEFADPGTGYRAFIDVDSFIDHHFLVEIARNVDGYVLSTFLHKDREGLINMGPIWDYNGSLGGADYFCTYEIAGWHFEFDESECGGGGETFPADNPNAYHWYTRLFQDPSFAQRYGERWGELRAEALSTEKMMADIDATAALLGEAQERNFKRWEILGEYIWPNSPGFEERDTFEKEVAHMKSWLKARLLWMDSQLL